MLECLVLTKKKTKKLFLSEEVHFVHTPTLSSLETNTHKQQTTKHEMATTQIMRVVVTVLVLLCSLPLVVVALPPHGWDCVTCANNSMLAGNWAIRSPWMNNTDLWWAESIANSYAAVALNMDTFDPSLTVEQARILKKINPKIKFLVYQNTQLGPLTQDADQTIKQHPEWWCRDDAGNPIGTRQGNFLNLSLPEVRAWYNNYPLTVFGDDAAALLDGIFNDGMGYAPNSLVNTNLARNDQYFAAKMKLGDEARAIYGGLNGGEVCWSAG